MKPLSRIDTPNAGLHPIVLDLEKEPKSVQYESWSRIAWIR